MLAAGRLMAMLPDLPSKQFAAAQAADESRHVEIFERLLREHLGAIFPLGSGTQRRRADRDVGRQIDFAGWGFYTFYARFWPRIFRF